MKYLSILPVILLVACTKVAPPAAPPEPVKDTTEQSALPAETGTVVTDQEQK